MDRLKIEASYRSDMSKSRMKQVRREGYVTGSVFGHSDEPVAVEVKLDDLVRQIKTSEQGLTSLIDLKIKGAPRKSDGIVIIKEFYKDPVSRKVLDIQFQRINLKEKISVGVPIVLVGEPQGVQEGGMLDQVTDELHIKCLPTDIPPRIELDVSALNIGDHIKADEVKLEGDVDVLTDPEAIICTCRAPHVVVEEEEVAEEVEEAEAEAAEAEVEGAAAEAEAAETEE